MDFRRRRTLFNRCQPDLPLPPGDDRYIDLDKARVRGIDWVARLAAAIELSDTPTCQLFTGLPGSGKSTELLRLAERLRDPARGNFLAVVLPAQDYFDLTAEVDVPDVVLALFARCERDLLEAEGENPESAMESGYLRRLWDFLIRTDVNFTKLDLKVDKVAGLSAELRTRPTLRQHFRETIGAHLNRFLAEARDEFLLMQARASALGRAGIVAIVDSMEKLRGTSTTWDKVLESAERVFSDGAPHLRLPIHVVHTIPPALVSRRRFTDTKFIPMIKLHEHPKDGGARFRAGYDAAMELLIQRVPELELHEIFGPTTEQRLDRLIEWSGGYPRELVRLMNVALQSEAFPLSDDDFERLLNEVGSDYRRIIPANSFHWLARVAIEHYLTLESPEHRQIADAMLSNNVVLRYLNNEDWFDLHPSIRRIPGIAAEIARLRGATPSASA